ncbi:curli-like amyloid fiber formation chaperone CsgH [Maribacter forsetii]|uniref:curli-like amyloid fiber formation chaperone CsgH n=1 Tax=Maribacter forsetii TaxID=444515 RepID=UPI00055CF1C1|nr:curli-like amyloid fiber formation chaperone CsgH [Maribacter forsetii]
MTKKTYILLLVCISVFSGISQETSTVTSDIVLTPQKNNLVSISGVCSNNSLQIQNLNYTLDVQKISKSGNTSNNKQSGTFTVDPNQKTTLSTTTININPKDHTKVILTLFNSKNIQITQQRKVITAKETTKK